MVFKDVDAELDILCDASTVAYGAVTYLKCISIHKNKIICSFVMSKSQLALIKEPTVRVQDSSNKHQSELEFPVWIVKLWNCSPIIIQNILSN